MSDHEADLRTRVGELEEALLQQTTSHATAMGLFAQHINALRAVNAALVGALSGRSFLDLERVRAAALASLAEQDQSDGTGELVRLMLTIEPPKPPAPPEDTLEQVRERARARFTVFEGGQSTEEPKT